MPLATCLVNDTTREFSRVRDYPSETIALYLNTLEKNKCWDLAFDEIYICIYNKGLLDYLDVTSLAIPPSNAGEIINEYFILI
jgi:hypothetical protein